MVSKKAAKTLLLGKFLPCNVKLKYIKLVSPLQCTQCSEAAKFIYLYITPFFL